jgi:hypothetical protein
MFSLRHLIRASSCQPAAECNFRGYHAVTIDVSAEGNHTRLSLAQDNHLTEQARQHSEKNWTMMLESLKRLLEQ